MPPKKTRKKDDGNLVSGADVTMARAFGEFVGC